ncbi:hypothetical protein BKK44_26210 [Bacillus cereus]|nr:hypothetical protein BKK44_26210 [Bacillus cereus]
MNRKIILIIAGLIGAILFIFIGIQFTNKMYSEKTLFAKSNPLKVAEEKETLEKELQRTKIYYKNVTRVLEKLNLDDVGEIEGLPNKLGTSQEEFLGQFFASTLIGNEQVFLSNIDPNQLLNDKDVDLSSNEIKKIMTQISRDKKLKEVYLQSKILKGEEDFEVVVLLEYKDEKEKNLKLQISKSRDYHHDTSGHFLVNTSLSDIKKQLDK